MSIVSDISVYAGWMDDGLSFGEWLDDRIAASGMTQTEFAEAVEAGQSTVSSWINGKQLPRKPSLRRIALVLGVDVRDVFRRAGRPLGAAYVAPDQRFAQMKENAALYEEMRDLSEAYTALDRALSLLRVALDRRGVVIARMPEKSDQE